MKNAFNATPPAFNASDLIKTNAPNVQNTNLLISKTSAKINATLHSTMKF